MSNTQPQYIGSIPENYDRYLVPALFRPFAESMAAGVRRLNPSSVLELACGTGAVTRCLSAVLPATARFVATDYSQDMLSIARQSLGDQAPIEWQVADACALPFEDGSFDVIVCQFGAMSFPDKSAAMGEAFRILSPGGHLLFNTWGRISMNPVFQSVEETLRAMFPEEETPFMPTPFSTSDPDQHRDLAQAAGFRFVTVVEESHALGPHDPASLAAGFAFGTPLGQYLSNQGYDLDKIHAALAAGLAAELGDPVARSMQAIVCHATKA